jgi:transcriptional regulator with XRE-family HTH domain
VRLPPTRTSQLRGRALRYYREERGLTQGALAAAAKVGVATISRLESRGVRDERVYVQVRRALDVSEADITGWVAARVIDRRLMPLVIWFAALAPSDQDAIAHVLELLFKGQR